MSPARKGKTGGRSGNLANRLKRMQGMGALEKPSRGNDGVQQTNGTMLPGWTRIADFIWQRHSSTEATCPAKLTRTPLTPEGGSVADMLFLDIETTGLSGGAGTLAFLVGIGSRRGGRFTVEQLFLQDYPGEPEFLSLLEQRLDTGAVYVSYNGKSFDTQVLKSRFVMNGKRVEFPRQLDLLHPARKLWSSMLPSCSLGTVEEHILDVERELDIPGSMVPEIYFDYLSSGDPAPLLPVFAHHLEDIYSLETLLGYMNRFLADPDDKRADPFQVGRWLVETGFPGGMELLGKALEKGNPRAGLYSAAVCRRTGDFGRAADIWEGMFQRWTDRRAALELAKYLEHKVKDYGRAAEYVAFLLQSDSDKNETPKIESRERLLHRLSRIKAKEARAIH